MFRGLGEEGWIPARLAGGVNFDQSLLLTLLPLHWPMWLTRTSVPSATLRSRRWSLSRPLHRQDWKCPTAARWEGKRLVENRVRRVPGSSAQPQAPQPYAGTHSKISGLRAGAEMAEAGKGNKFWPEKTSVPGFFLRPTSPCIPAQRHTCAHTQRC